MAQLLLSLQQLPQVGESGNGVPSWPSSWWRISETKKPYRLEEQVGHRVAMEARNRGLLLRPIGNVIVLMPPLSTSLPELRRMVEILQASIETVTLVSKSGAGS